MAHKKEQDVVHDTTGMNLEKMLHERSQKWENTECDSTYMKCPEWTNIHREVD